MISFFQKLVWLYRGGYLLRDFKNITRYGYFEAPRAFEQISINPSLVKESVTNPWTREHSALVIDGDWDLLKRRQIQNLPKVKMCKAHFEDGLSWEKTGIIDYATRRIKRQGKCDDCMSVDDVIQRYNNLDELYSTLKVGQPFLPQSKLFENSIREKGGIIIHVGRNRELLFGGGGHHRLAIAQILKLDEIPAQLGVIHAQAMGEDLMCGLRRGLHPSKQCHVMKKSIV